MVKSKDGAAEIKTVNLGSALKQETFYYGIKFVTYTDYSAVVAEMQNTLYAE